MSGARISAILHQVVAGLETRQSALFDIQGRWAAVVGRALAAHTQPVGFKQGTLFVRANSPGDGFALHRTRETLSAALTQATGRQINEVVVVAGEASQGSHAVSHRPTTRPTQRGAGRGAQRATARDSRAADHQ